MSAKYRKNQTGSTLIELLIATLVTGSVLVAVAINMMSSIQRTAHARYTDIATTLAQESLEALLRDRAKLGWDGFLATYPAGNYCLIEADNAQSAIAPGPCAAEVTKNQQVFTRTINLTRAGQVLTARVEVGWEMGRISPSPRVVLTQEFRQTF